MRFFAIYILCCVQYGFKETDITLTYHETAFICEKNVQLEHFNGSMTEMFFFNVPFIVELNISGTFILHIDIPQHKLIVSKRRHSSDWRLNICINSTKKERIIFNQNVMGSELMCIFCCLKSYTICPTIIISNKKFKLIIKQTNKKN